MHIGQVLDLVSRYGSLRNARFIFLNGLRPLASSAAWVLSLFSPVSVIGVNI